MHAHPQALYACNSINLGIRPGRCTYVCMYIMYVCVYVTVVHDFLLLCVSQSPDPRGSNLPESERDDDRLLYHDR